MEKPEQYSDIDIIGKITAGQIGLFEILIRRYNPYLYKTGRAYNYSHEDTQDLMQDAFIDAYMNLSKFENRSTFKTWIVKIMLHNCYRKQQKSSYKNEVRTAISDHSKPLFSSQNHTDTNSVTMNRELSNVIENALKEVPSDYRMVFTLREMNGMNVAETAEILSISEANVKVRLNRAKAMLRKGIEKSYSADDIFEFNLIYCNAIVNKVMQRINNLEAEKS
ncbi:MAG TPA: sigma-70 family RNA polymerase sigma factor [Flavobacterium sp.]|nr:sigma-70 family RNA polymerase sigma factor [Flavobacterium sp.]